jgi:hypothetical protein
MRQFSDLGTEDRGGLCVPRRLHGQGQTKQAGLESDSHVVLPFLHERTIGRPPQKLQPLSRAAAAAVWVLNSTKEKVSGMCES